MAINSCPVCLEKQREIDDLKEEVKRLRVELRREQRKMEDGPFGSSTPSSKIPIKASTGEKEKKPKGARPGHKGNGRKSHEDESVDKVVEVESEFELCPECGFPLEKKGIAQRSVLDIVSGKPEKVLFRLPKRHCYGCGRSFMAQASGVLPKSLFGNQFIAHAITMHYLYGVPLGRICESMGVGSGSLTEMFHRIGRLFAQVPGKLVEEYRQAPVKHADETSWRTDGKNGYVWLFATPELSIFQFGKNRSSQVAHAIFGKDALPGVLVVDRYGGYNKAPCEIQYCYAHLLRHIQDLEKEFSEDKEVTSFVAVAAPLLALAMGLRGQPITDKQFYRKASKLASEIKDVMNKPALHQGIRRIQDIFRENEQRMYQWAKNRAVPPDNNLAERDLRPSVVARKISFGSTTNNGAATRSVLTTVTMTLKKRGYDVEESIKKALDRLSKDMNQDPYALLLPRPDP
jgi:transposase